MAGDVFEKRYSFTEMITPDLFNLPGHMELKPKALRQEKILKMLLMKC